MSATQHVARLMVSCVFLPACYEGLHGGSTGSSDGTGGTSPATTATSSTSGADSGSTTGGLPPPPSTNPGCADVSGPIDAVVNGTLTYQIATVAEGLTMSDFCPATEGVDPEWPAADIAGSVIYLPDPWPPEDSQGNPVRVPLVLFAHGNGHRPENYVYLLSEALAGRGYAVISLDAIGMGSATARAQSMGCMLAWLGYDDDGPTDTDFETGVGGFDLFYRQDPEEEPVGTLRCGLTVGGHSEGGRGAWYFVRDRHEPIYEDYWYFDSMEVENFEAAALFALAPNMDETPPGELMPATQTVPEYIVAAGQDDDVGGEAFARYDRSPPEADLQDDARFSAFHVVYGEVHDNFGGSGMGISTAADPATFTAAEMIPAFLEWHVLGQNAATNRAKLLLEDFPQSLLDASIWSGFRGYGDIAAGQDCASRPETSSGDELSCDDALGCTWNGSTCVESDCDDHDSSEDDCRANYGCAWEEGQSDCHDRPLVFGQFTIGSDDQDPTVVFQNFEDVDPDREPEVGGTLVDTVDEAWDLDETYKPEQTLHRTRLAQLEYGVSGSEGTLTIPSQDELPIFVDVSGANVLSIRMGSIRESGAQPTDETSCEAVDQVSLVPRVELVDPMDYLQERPSVQVGPLPLQDAGWFIGKLAIADDCWGSQGMQTYRIPLTEFCVPGMDLTEVTGVNVHFDDPGDAAKVWVDSIEFTKSAFDDPEGVVCPTLKTAWACEADTLGVDEISCSDEPVSNSCPAGAVETTAVTLPEVDYNGFTFDGWLAHAPAGSVVDEQDPTTAELDWITARCVEACQLEYADNPDIDVDECDDAGAFLEPYLVEEPNVGVFLTIPEANLDGSGVFTGESLSCSLNNCC